MTIASILRAGVLGLALAAGSLPAQAAGLPFHFSIGDDHRHRTPFLCPPELTDRQLRNAITDQGYRNVFLNVPHDFRIQVRATQGDWVYLLRVSTCTGRILDRQRLRHS